MAPEANTRDPEPKQDVHALACVIYELLTGKPAFYTTPDIPRHPSLYPDPPKSLTEAAWEVLKNGFAFEAEKRPASAGELVKAVRKAQATPKREPPPPAQLVVRSNVYGDQLWIDGEEQGSTGKTVHELKAGEHQIKVSKEGYEDYTGQLSLKAGEKQTLRVVLKPLPARLDTESNVADAGLWLDGGYLGKVGESYRLPPGKHRLEVRKAGYKSLQKTLTLPPGKTLSQRFELEKLPPSKTKLPPVQNIHGWSSKVNWEWIVKRVFGIPISRRPKYTPGNWSKVQQLQKQTAQALGKPVVFRDTLKDGSKGPEMVIIPAGKFLMGSPKDEPERRDDERQHPVTIAQPFAIGKCEVTFEEYDRFAKATGRKLPDDEGWGRGKRPVINVSWEDALAYTEWLREETGEAYGLPTEAQWEYAARGGTATPFYTGNCISTDQANYNGNYGHGDCGSKTKTRKYLEETTEVGCYPPNPFGLYDMAGNVWEWTGSLYEEDYQGREQKTSKKDASGVRVLRGGSWRYGPADLRAACRLRNNPGDRFGNVGFRFVRSAP